MKIMLTCMTGVSSSNFAKKLEEASRNIGMNCLVESTTVANLKNNLNGVDVVLVGPQLKYKLNEINQIIDGKYPVVEIDTLDFNILKCRKIVEEAIEAVNNFKK